MTLIKIFFISQWTNAFISPIIVALFWNSRKSWNIKIKELNHKQPCLGDSRVALVKRRILYPCRKFAVFSFLERHYKNKDNSSGDPGHFTNNLAAISSLKVNNENTRTMCEICSQLAIKTPERNHWTCSVSIVDFEQVNTGSDNALVSLLSWLLLLLLKFVKQ